MRFSEYRAKAPFKESVAPKVLAVVEQALVGLGAERDPECWVVWGDDPAGRYLLFVPTPAGLAQVNVRVAVPGEGPRAGGKVVRWNRVQLGELAIEIQGGHRLVTFQIENQVLNGADANADGIAVFAQVLFDAVDGRVMAAPKPGRVSSAGRRPATGARRAASPARPKAAKGPAA